MTDYLEEALVLASVPKPVDDATLGLYIPREVARDVDNGDFNCDGGHHRDRFSANNLYP